MDHSKEINDWWLGYLSGTRRWEDFPHYITPKALREILLIATVKHLWRCLGFSLLVSLIFIVIVIVEQLI
jgi:hypothetical protein